jgi:predicted DNA-binding protein
MNNDYEQMELDTRSALQAVIEDLTTEAIASAGLLIQEHHRQAAHATMTAPPYVRNRHEAYGVAAEQLVKITSAVKAIKNDTDTLLGTLADPNFNAIDATSSIVNSTTKAAYVLLVAAAEMKRTLNNLYTAETTSRDDATPLEELAEAAFEEVEPADDGENEMEE